ncbi:MAG: 4Fe-4S dicluster domain-containing protein [Erysipelotrichaceae bacterium]|nr:4Fe-4S dicluster domain-containing protein [Erysipelotrichaceae bacterium]
MPIFDTKIQELKYQALKEIATNAYNDTLVDNLLSIPKKIIPNNTATMRCCVYKERAIFAERLKIAMGGNKAKKGIVEVIDIACDECPMSGYEVTSICRGCLAHPCYHACKMDAISFDNNHVAFIDKSKCVNCGSCSKVCPYSAIANRSRPCENSCKVKAINASENQAATIDYDKCIDCGVCIYTCPFGALVDKSYLINAIDYLRKSNDNSNYHVIAIVAPSIVAQFTNVTLPKIVSGLKKLGFYSVAEVALGADMVADREALELAEKGFLTSSCCPAFVRFIEKNYPTLTEHISSNLSPMATLAKAIKSNDPDCRIVFIGPCTAKKAEVRRKNVRDYVDVALTFEELQALFDARNVDLKAMDDDSMEDASYFGRVFARSGGLSEAVREALKEHNITDFDLKAIQCSGIEECRLALMKAKKGVLSENFIEGMACIGGCVSGAGVLHRSDTGRRDVDKHASESIHPTITEAIRTAEKKH